MSKLELIQVLKQTFAEYTQIVQELDSNTSLLKKSIAEGECISDSLIKEIQEQLEDVHNRQNDFISQYEVLQIGTFPTKLNEIEIQLEQCQKRIEQIEKYSEAVEFFKQLHSDEENVQKLLVERQQKLANIDMESMNEEQLCEQLACYVWLFQAYYETNPRTKFSLIYKLFSYFEEKIITEVYFGTLTVGQDVVLEMASAIISEEVEEVVTETVPEIISEEIEEVVTETVSEIISEEVEEVVTETVPQIILEEVAVTIDNDIKEDIIEDIAEEDVEEPVEEEPIQTEVIEQNLLEEVEAIDTKNIEIKEDNVLEDNVLEDSSEELYPIHIQINLEEDNSNEDNLNEENELSHDELVDTIMSNLDSNVESTENNLDVIPNEQNDNEKIYQEMLVANKFYCATAYAKALSKTIPQYESIYRQLAYAVNDPMEVCTYNSDTIYNVYYSDNQQMSDHYGIAATLRNYFLDQFSYDYSLRHLHSMISGSDVLEKNQELSNVLYTLLQFKADYYVGIDKYADYREKGRSVLEEQIEKTCKDAKMIYQNYFVDAIRENIDNRRYMQMLKLIFNQKSDLGQYLNVIFTKENDMLDMLREFLRERYIKDEAQISEENIDLWKINREIDRYWELSKAKMNSVRETADLMSELRTNAAKKIQKVVSIMARYIFLIDSSIERSDTQVLYYYKKIRQPLLESIRVAKENLLLDDDKTLENRAGNAVLIATLSELESRLDGSYVEGTNQYFYIDFLKNDKVLLDEMFVPVLDEVLELPELSLANRIINHSKEEEMSWEERMDSILNGEDDYGSAELILQYLNEKNILEKNILEKNILLESSRLQNIDIEKAVVYPQKDTENRRKSFIEELEFAQSYGKIDNTVENSKEMMLQVMETWFEWANETRNYGFFEKILKAFYEKIEKDAQVRTVELEKNLKVYLEQHPNWSESDLVCKAMKQIQDRIAKQNYTAAEDLMNRLVNEDFERNIDINQDDYLEDFFEEYEFNYRKSFDPTVKNLISTKRMNKDIKGASRLVEYWPKGFGVKLESMKIFLSSLGFAIGSIEPEAPIQGKMDCFFVTLKRPENGKRSNYKHPISVFGSEAEEKGFRVVCVFGNTDASRLIDICNEIGNAKNTLILLNYSLTLADRRTLARKTKTDLAGKTFAVMDRVVLAYLAKNYIDTAVNRMLMYIIMPFASYQPYIDKSADVMPQEIFIGRKNELEKIESPTGVNIVYGGRQLGKTALLRMAQKDIDRNENGDRAVLVSVWGKNYHEVAKVISETLRREKILKNVDVTDDWDELASQIKDKLYEEEDRIPYLLLMIDEADTFIASCESIRYKPFEALKDIQSIGSGRFKFVVAGLRNIVRFKKESALGDNVGFVHLDSLTVKPFKTMEARELLELPLSYLGFRFPKDNETEVLISTIFGTTNYFPGLIQLYCTKLIEAMKRDYAGYAESETPPYIVLFKKNISKKFWQNRHYSKIFEINFSSH